MYISSHLQTATQLLKDYTGHPPFHQYLKNFFKENKKYGSKDRKYITQLCYSYYRVGQALPNDFSTQRFAAGILLTSTEPNAIIEYLQPSWNVFFKEKNISSINEQLNFLQKELLFDDHKIFPFITRLSAIKNVEAFQKSHLIQPDVYLRIRPNKKEEVLRKLEKLHWVYQLIKSDIISLPNGYKVDEYFKIDEEVIIQDLSSQKVGSILQKVQEISKQPIQTIWDICAGSGGKSILAYDILRNIQITVSDIRKSILQNLKERFYKAGIKNYQSFVLDITETNNISSSFQEFFDLVMADVPCTGSGTWSRTPEQLLFFKEEQINFYVDKQKKILQNIIPTIKSNGWLLYCTCSVFKAENEDQVSWIQQEGLQLIQQELIEGYTQQADTLFVALFYKSSL